MESFTSTVDGIAGSFKDLVSYGLLNPLQSLLADSPWWLAFVGLLRLAVVIGGLRAVVPSRSASPASTCSTCGTTRCSC